MGFLELENTVFIAVQPIQLELACGVPLKSPLLTFSPSWEFSAASSGRLKIRALEARNDNLINLFIARVLVLFMACRLSPVVYTFKKTFCMFYEDLLLRLYNNVKMFLYASMILF